MESAEDWLPLPRDLESVSLGLLSQHNSVESWSSSDNFYMSDSLSLNLYESICPFHLHYKNMS